MKHNYITWIVITLILLFIMPISVFAGNKIKEPCTSDTDCVSSYQTKYGFFYGYCDTVCRPADGIASVDFQTNLNEYEWCKQHSSSSFYADVKDWTLGTSCEELFPGYTTPIIGDIGFKATYDKNNKQVNVFDDHSTLLETTHNDLFGNTYASTSKVSGTVMQSTNPGGNTLSIIDANGNELKNNYDSLDRITATYNYNAFEEQDFYVENIYDNNYLFGSCSDGDDFNLLCEIRDNSGYVRYHYDINGRITRTTIGIYDKNVGDKVYIMTYAYDDADNLVEITLPDGKKINYDYSSISQLTKLGYGIKVSSPELVGTDVVSNGDFGADSDWNNFPYGALVVDPLCRSNGRCVKAIKGNWNLNQLLTLEPNAQYKLSYYSKTGTVTTPRVLISSNEDYQYTGSVYIGSSHCGDASSGADWVYNECTFTAPVNTDNNPAVIIMYGSGGVDESQYVYVDDLVLEKIEHGYEEVAQLTYTASGAIDEKILNPEADNPDDVIYGKYHYDEKNQLRGIEFNTVVTELFARTLEYDKVGNVDKIAYTVDGADPLAEITYPDEEFTYDNLYRLTDAVYAGDKTFKYNYGSNTLGDRQFMTIDGIQTDYNYDSLSNRLSEIISPGLLTTYQYDNNGNTVSIESTSGTLTYEYDSLNRMTKSTGNNQEFYYTYDYSNKRIKKQTPEEITFYIYQGNNVIYEENYPINPCFASCGDVNGDGALNDQDLNTFINSIYGMNSDIVLCAANLNNNENNYVDVNDALILIDYLYDDGELSCTGQGILSPNPQQGLDISDFKQYLAIS